MNTKLLNKDVVDLLAPRSPEVRNLALPARFFVFPTIPDISEQVDAQARIIGYRCGPKSADTVCMLMPTRVRVNLGPCVRNGTARSGKTSERTGKLHRHVKLKSKADLQSAALKSLLSAAIARREELAQKSKK